jgi:hypothetical protein
MLGAVSTKLSLNSQKYLGYKLPEEMSDAEIEEVRKRLVDPMKSMPVGELRNALQAAMAGEQSNAPTSAQEAAALIVDATKGEDWRVVIGPGAKLLDGEVRNDPMHAYESDFYDNLLKKRDQLLNST